MWVMPLNWNGFVALFWQAVDFLQTYNGAVTAFATVWIAIFTIVLALVTGRQARLTRQAIDLSREEFISTHRPQLVVRQFLVDPVLEGNTIKIHFAVVNSGSTEAIPNLGACEIALWNGKSYEAPGVDSVVKPLGIPPIAAGQRVSFHSESKFVVAAGQLKAILADELAISILGEITYRDRRGVQRRTAFRRNYDRSIDKFIPSPYPDDEYCD
jgi:hypothetical protein